MRIIRAEEAAALVGNGWTLATGGFVGAGHPEALTSAIERRFLDTALPRDLTLVYAAGQGDRQSRGAGHFAHEGLIRKVIGGHWGAAPRLGQLAVEERIEAHNWPQGVISQLYRAIAGAKPGVVTRIGLHTFVDPRHDGACLNRRAGKSEIEVVTLRGEEFLFYPSFPIHCALLRGTTADLRGNISAEEEALHHDMLAMAQAARNSGGIVIVQVKRLTEAGTLDPNLVRIPGILVDYVVLCEDPAQHWQTYGEEYNPAYTGAIREPEISFRPAPLDIRKVIQRRAFLELARLDNPVANLGTGIPAGVGQVAREEGETNFTLTVEAGPIGGTPATFLSFGAATNPEAIVDQAAQFDFYDGGGLDITFLGLAEADVEGNVNVSRFGERIAGVGGFINISQTARHIVFMGTFTTGGLEVAAGDGRLAILREGTQPKIVERVGHLSFNGPYVAGRGSEVLYVTERAVLRLLDGRLTLTEIAPGVDLGRDVLAHMPKGVAVAPDLALMDARIFREGPMRG